MQRELKAANPDLNVEILGVNRSDEAVFNNLIIAERTLPWLQDPKSATAWSAWEVTWRDVFVVDSQNRMRFVFNLTAHDLTYPSNYSTLKQMFLQTARVVDSDGDGLPDDWEKAYFGNLLSGTRDDPDHDGHSNLEEYSFGTDPTNASSVPVLQPKLTVPGPDGFLTLEFRRRSGTFLNYRVEASPDLGAWTSDPLEVGPVGLPLLLFDGTGTMRVTYSLKRPTGARPAGCLRIHASPGPQP